MSRPNDVARLVRQGNTPADIADNLRVTLDSVEGYLYRAVGQRLLRRSDVYFCVPPERRKSDSTLDAWSDPQLFLGDMYEDIRCIEVSLHRKIREVLVKNFGDGETGWWRQGIPEKVRVECQKRREMDQDNPGPPFCYSDLLDLYEIMEAEWSLFCDLFPDYAANRKQLGKDLRQLNRIRNKVMHPVRGFVPSEEDFDFVRKLQKSFQCG